MNSRERWTVYPLLFLTLGIALTDKLTRQVQTDRVISKHLLQTDRVICKNLLVTDGQGKAQVVLGSTSGGGIVQTQGNGPGLNVVLGHYPTVAGLWFTNANDVPVGPSLIIPTAPRRQRPQPEATPPVEESRQESDAAAQPKEE
jgi:hypothetical protein